MSSEVFKDATRMSGGRASDEAIVAMEGVYKRFKDFEALKNIIRDALQPLTSSQHINGNQWAEIEGDRATAGCYFTVHMFKEGLADGEHFEMGGRYDDELLRTPAGWRFTSRTITILWSEGNRGVRWQD